MVKRFLIPVLALVALGLPARADVITYCTSGCGSEDQTAFNNDLATDGFTLQSLETFTATDLSGGVYTDPTTGIVFEVFPSGSLTLSGASIETTVANIEIIVPATYLGLELTAATSSGSLCTQASTTICPTGETSGFVGFTNPGGTSPWTVYISSTSGSAETEINDFSVAAGASDTPEVGTMFLIGAGLIAMRWMRRVPRRIFRTPQLA